jgi:DNA-binding response OmpR family regulator
MPIKVVAMDDESDILRMVQRKLEKEGFIVITASDGDEGLEKVLVERPDVMILDVMMPGKNGYQVANEVKEKLGDQAPVIIMLTAKSEASDIAKGLSEGADDYVTKPFSPRELIERIKVALIKSGKNPEGL